MKQEIHKWTDGYITFVGTEKQWMASSYPACGGFWQIY